MYSCLNNGMSQDGFESFDMGMLFDYLTTVSNMHYDAKHQSADIREANQKDYNKF